MQVYTNFIGGSIFHGQRMCRLRRSLIPPVSMASLPLVNVGMGKMLPGGRPLRPVEVVPAIEPLSWAATAHTPDPPESQVGHSRCPVVLQRCPAASRGPLDSTSGFCLKTRSIVLRPSKGCSLRVPITSGPGIQNCPMVPVQSEYTLGSIWKGLLCFIVQE